MPSAKPLTSASAARRIDELGRIILAYSEVTEKLQQSHDQLQQTVSALRDELSEKSRMLERRNRLAALGEMAAGMAHEIRNPLGGIQLYASLLAKDLADRPASARLVEKISGGVKRLEGLVSQVLAFTREMRPSLVRTDVRHVVDEAVGLAGRAIEAGGVRVAVEGPGQLEARADPLLMGQAALNLVLNAVEATPRGGQVTVTLAAGPSGDTRQFVLVVEDDGPGIAPDAMDRIFNPFFTTKETGTGLGLAIVHRIVEAHDGTIRASNRPSGGARFEVTI